MMAKLFRQSKKIRAKAPKTDGSITDISDNVLVQIEESKIEEKNKKVTYTPDYDGFDGNKGAFGDWREGYERKIPERFDEGGDSVDTFTRKMLKNYATEGSDKWTGLPDGSFTVSKAHAKEAAVEVLNTHLGL